MKEPCAEYGLSSALGKINKKHRRSTLSPGSDWNYCEDNSDSNNNDNQR